jgi:hypothetical protein
MKIESTAPHIVDTRRWKYHVINGFAFLVLAIFIPDLLDQSDISMIPFAILGGFFLGQGVVWFKIKNMLNSANGKENEQSNVG